MRRITVSGSSSMIVFPFSTPKYIHCGIDSCATEEIGEGGLEPAAWPAFTAFRVFFEYYGLQERMLKLV